VKNLLTYLTKQGRIIYSPAADRYSVNGDCDANTDAGLFAAFWVLLDFIERAEYHFISDFPVKISFFADNEMYDIIHVPAGKEMLLNHARAALPEDSSRRIILIDDPWQSPSIGIPNTVVFCMVDNDGSVQML